MNSAINYKKILVKIDSLIKLNEYKEAIKIIANLHSEYSPNYATLNMLGNCYSALGIVDKAIGAYKKSIALKPRQHEVYYQLAKLLKAKLNFEDALKYSMKAVGLVPNNLNYLVSIGYIYVELNDTEEATKAFESAISIKPMHVNANLGLAKIYNCKNQNQKAIQLLEPLLNENKDNYVFLYNLALFFQYEKNYDKAISYYESVISLGLKRVDVHKNLARLYFFNGENSKGMAVIEKGLRILPYELELNQLNADLRWEMNDRDYLSHYRSLDKDLMNQQLLSDFFYKTLRTGKLSETSSILKKLEIKFSDSIATSIARCEYLYCSAQYEDIIIYLKDKEQSRILHELERDWLGRAYIASGDYNSSVQEYSKLLSSAPDNQGYWCLYATALKFIKNEEYEYLYNYDKLVFSKKISPPKGYGNIKDFNRELKNALISVHSMEVQPINQSLVNGTQTVGRIFERTEAIIEKFQEVLKGEIYQLINKLPFDAKHPTLKYASSDFKFSGAWSVKLKKNGFHKSHFHSEGWYSGVYYVNLPPLKGNEGKLMFGKPDVVIPAEIEPDRVVDVEEGKLVLFPSFFWHGTYPFQAEKERLTIAFDIIPNCKRV